MNENPKTMKPQTHGEDDPEIYTETCECGRKVEVSTEEDNNNPEYYTDIRVRCVCGKWVAFVLPVN